MQAASKLSALVLGWHSQAASNFGSGRAAWEQFSLLDAFKPEIQQDAAHSDSVQTEATPTEALHLKLELTEATHTEALHLKPALMCPADQRSMAVDDEASLTANVQNSTEADGKPKGSSNSDREKGGRAKGSRDKHGLVTTAETLSTVSKVGPGAGAAANTRAIGSACGAVAHTGCKQPPGRSRQTPARKCKLVKKSNQQADSATAPEGADVKTHGRSLAPQHKRQRLDEKSTAAP